VRLPHLVQAARSSAGSSSTTVADVPGVPCHERDDARCEHDRCADEEGALVPPSRRLGEAGATGVQQRGGASGGECREHLPPTLLRLSVGCEYVEDLWSDLDSALAGSRPTAGR